VSTGRLKDARFSSGLLPEPGDSLGATTRPPAHARTGHDIARVRDDLCVAPERQPHRRPRELKGVSVLEGGCALRARLGQQAANLSTRPGVQAGDQGAGRFVRQVDERPDLRVQRCASSRTGRQPRTLPARARPVPGEIADEGVEECVRTRDRFCVHDTSFAAVSMGWGEPPGARPHTRRPDGPSAGWLRAAAVPLAVVLGGRATHQDRLPAPRALGLPLLHAGTGHVFTSSRSR